MPASPPLRSKTPNKWRKRNRGSQANKHQQRHDEDDEEEPNGEENEREDDSERQIHHSNSQHGSHSQAHREIEVISDDEVQISQFPRVIRRAVNRPHSSVFKIIDLEGANAAGENKVRLQDPPFLENVSHGQLQAVSSVPADCPFLPQNVNNGGNSAYVITPPPLLEGRGVFKRFGSKVHVVPMHSDWFSPTTVHRLERQVLPHFFSGRSSDHTPEKYIEFRNYMVARYMEDLGKRITVSDFQGLLVGVENEDLTRIVQFLDHWGIINYCAQDPQHKPGTYDSYMKEETSGAICVLSDALKSIDSLIKFDKPKCKLRADEVCSTLTTDDADISDFDDKIREHLSENHCYYCSCPLLDVYYQSQKETYIHLCTNCFHDGRFIIGHSSIDFMRVDSTRSFGDLDGDNWTDQETLLLLEAIETCNENWNKIAEHVGTKSKFQCLLHFLRLPLDDCKLENINVPSMPSTSPISSRDNCEGLQLNLNDDSAGSFHQSSDLDNRLPFANSENPVMALVAFLTSAIGPRVAAACALAALATLSEDNSDSMLLKEALGSGNRMNSKNMQGRTQGPHGETASSDEQNGNKAEILGSWYQYEENTHQYEENTPLSAEKVKEAAKAGLSAAAMKAKLFADQEEREIKGLCANLVSIQLRRTDLKRRRLEEIETLLEKECEQVKQERERFSAERSRIISVHCGTGGAIPPMNVSDDGSSMVSNINESPGLQMISGYLSQPSISGCGNRQPIHPHMSFVPHPSMFGLGQRVPLSMIQQPQSSTSNPMFNAPGNVQPTTNHPFVWPVSGTHSSSG